MDNTIILRQLVQKKNLTTAQVRDTVSAMLEARVSPVRTAALLTAFAMKGETPEEILGFVEIMQQRMHPISAPKDTIDVCGTGGDISGTFNISTAVGFVVAAAGVSVAKHGNRAASSKSGSADVLEALGIHIMLSPTEAEDILQKVGIVFLFAPVFHSAFKVVGAIRKELGIPTIFNSIGPFANPAKVKRQLIGVSNIQIAEKLAIVAQQLTYSHVCIVTSNDGLDEVSISAQTILFDIQGKQIKKQYIDPGDYGITPAALSDIQGGSPAENAQIIIDIFSGQNGPKRDIVLLNSAVALFVSGKVRDIAEGVIVATAAIDTGAAKRIVENLRKETNQYASHT